MKIYIHENIQITREVRIYVLKGQMAYYIMTANLVGHGVYIFGLLWEEAYGSY